MLVDREVKLLLEIEQDNRQTLMRIADALEKLLQEVKKNER